VHSPNELKISAFDFNQRPFLVIWETTHACPLACVHCRASADKEASPDELTHDQAIKLLYDVKDMGTPIFIFSGGDPLMRQDLDELVRIAKSLRLRTGVIPAVSEMLTQARISELKASGLSQIAFSLDATTAGEHDTFRQVEGVFDHTLEAIEWAHQIQLPVQINSLINVHNTDSLDRLIDLIERLPIVFWEVFFLVPTGRGTQLPLMSAQKFEEAFVKIYALSQRVPFIVKITEAPHYRRFYIEQEMKKQGMDPACLTQEGVPLPEYLKRRSGPGGTIGRAPQGVNSGKGFVFVSHKGEVMPSGFLPVSAGNVKNESLKQVYREAPIMKALRDRTQLKGKCGPCVYNDVCGGSRARAFALTGDYLAEDPCCAYQPESLESSVI